MSGGSAPKNFKVGVCAGVFAFLCWVPVAVAGQTAPIRTTSGLISGVALPHGIEVFKGIPFAKPPVGDLRWQPPEPPISWKGVRQADRFGAPCMQPTAPSRVGPWTRSFLSYLPPSENCLYLNIWTAAKRTKSLRPVMVWIYGGGFTSGAGSVAIYNGVALARKGVVVVNCNYRVGAFGFLAYPGLTAESLHRASGDYALLDQIAALRWVKKNIAAFGGDPHEVTIFGQSAGALSIGDLIQSPLARGLFERAIIMSGPGVIPIPALMTHRSLLAAEAEGQKFALRLGAHSLAQLRAAPANKIVQASNGLPWAPIRDGWALRPGWHPRHEVPVIIGMVADDIGVGYYGAGPAPAMTIATYRKRLEALCGDEAPTCLKLYPATTSRQAGSALRSALRDRARVSLYKWALRQTKASQRIYIYFFNHKLPWPQHPEYGVFHSSELPYVFDNLRLLNRPWRPLDSQIAREISDYWTNFAKFDDPNAKNLPVWPAFHAGDQTIMQLGAPMKPIPLAPSTRMKFWTERLKEPLGD